MPNQMIYLTSELWQRLQKCENKSKTMSDALETYFNVLDKKEQKPEIEIIKETQEEMNDRDERQKIEEWLDANLEANKKEYLQGIKDKKWKGVVEYARTKLL